MRIKPNTAMRNTPPMQAELLMLAIMASGITIKGVINSKTPTIIITFPGSIFRIYLGLSWDYGYLMFIF
jgi:hypothetical protein